MNIPSEIRAADTIQWRDVPGADNLGNVISSSDYTLTYYLRTNTASEGATVVGSSATIDVAPAAEEKKEEPKPDEAKN